MRANRFGLPALMLFLCVRAVSAATIPVTTTEMDVADDGECSLIEAITAANTDAASGATPGECPAGSGADVIVLALQATYNLSTITSNAGQGANGLPIITTPITIEGNEATIRRNLDAPQFRIFQVNPSGSLTLDTVTVRYGRATDNFILGYGASGGCIHAAGPLHLKNALVQQCTAGDGSGLSNGGHGGGIFATDVALTIERSAIEGCHAGNGESAAGWGGGLYLASTDATITDSRIELNHAGDATTGSGGAGGGLLVLSGSIDLVRSVIHNNVAGSSTTLDGGRGGGLYATLATLGLESSSITWNQTGAGRNVAGNGGGVWMVASTLTANHSTVSFNRTSDGHTPIGGVDVTAGLGGNGAGLSVNGSTLSMTGCVISNNTCGDGGIAFDLSDHGRSGGSGAAIYAQDVSSVSLAACVISNNSSGGGGMNAGVSGIGGDGGSGAISVEPNVNLAIRDSVLRNNVAGNGGDAPLAVGGLGGSGGAISSDGTVIIERSSLTDNHAGDGGTGWTGGGAGTGGAIRQRANPLTLANVTISGNSAGDGGASQQAGVHGAAGGSGGGLHVESTAALYNVTISNNARGSGGTGMPTSGIDGVVGGLRVTLGTTTLRNTIVANSIGADCNATVGIVALSGPNLIEDNTCGASGGTDPRLAPLANNGHMTLSHALCVGAGEPDASCVGASPGLDTGNDATCTGSEVGSLDQRHAVRPFGEHCDLGSFESGPSAPVVVPFNVAARPGGSACVPVALGLGSGPASISNQMNLPGDLFSLVETTINPGIGPSSPSGKDVGSASIPGGSTVFTVSGSDAPLGAGLLYTATYALDPSTPPGKYGLTPTGGGHLVVTTCTGDCNANGEVSLGEVQRCVNHLLGAPLCNFDTGSNCPVADTNLNGEVSLGEVQQCVNRFLGTCP